MHAKFEEEKFFERNKVIAKLNNFGKYLRLIEFGVFFYFLVSDLDKTLTTKN